MSRDSNSSNSSNPKWFYLTPLVFTLLPLVYSNPYLKSRPQLRLGLTAGGIGLGLLHGFTLIASAGDAPRDEVEQYIKPPSRN